MSDQNAEIKSGVCRSSSGLCWDALLISAGSPKLVCKSVSWCNTVATWLCGQGVRLGSGTL